MKQKFNVFDDLMSLLKSNHIAVQESYEQTFLDIESRGFSFNSQVMFGMVHEIFKSNRMIAYNLLQNAIDEAKGAARVDIIANKYAQGELKAKMKSHVADELKHSKMFANAIELTGFFKEVDNSEEVSNVLEETFDFDDDLQVFICRVHSIEVRSWIIIRLYINELKAMKNEKLNPLIDILEIIKKDEMNHVVYTAEQINSWLIEKPSLIETLKECFLHTNKETWVDLSNMCQYLSANHEI